MGWTFDHEQKYMVGSRYSLSGGVALPVYKMTIKKTLSASTEDSNSRTPEINLMARYGLYLAGEVTGLTVMFTRTCSPSTGFFNGNTRNTVILSGA